MKILAIDFGEKNFGIALTDDLGIIAIPYSVEKNDNNFHKTLIKIINEKKINKIIAGFPLSLKGQEGEQALRVRKYFEELSKKINMNIELVDERFSTRISENKLRELKKNTEKDIDKFAAAIIIPDFTFLKLWCERYHIPYSTNEEMLQNEDVKKRFKKEIKKYNSHFGDYEQIKKFELIADEWTQQNGILTPTLKVKRPIILERYKSIIDKLFL